MSARSLISAVAALLAVSSVSATSNAAFYWTGWTSEEYGGLWCNQWNESPVGFACSGSYCDNIRLLCNTLPGDISLDPNTDYWTHWFSEETDGYATVLGIDNWFEPDQLNLEVCNWSVPTPSLMGGIACSGSYCDNLSLECDVPKRANGTVATFSNCAWSSSWLSEEQGYVYFGSNRFIAGVWCNGSYCDNKKFYVCTIS